MSMFRPVRPMSFVTPVTPQVVFTTKPVVFTNDTQVVFTTETFDAPLCIDIDLDFLDEDEDAIDMSIEADIYYRAAIAPSCLNLLNVISEEEEYELEEELLEQEELADLERCVAQVCADLEEEDYEFEEEQELADLERCIAQVCAEQEELERADREAEAERNWDEAFITEPMEIEDFGTPSYSPNDVDELVIGMELLNLDDIDINAEEVIHGEGPYYQIELIGSWEEYVYHTEQDDDQKYSDNCVVSALFANLSWAAQRDLVPIVRARGYATPIDVHFFAQEYAATTEHSQYNHSITMINGDGSIIFDTHPYHKNKIVLVATGSHVNLLDDRAYTVVRSHDGTDMYDVIALQLDLDHRYDSRFVTEEQFYEEGMVWNGPIDFESKWSTREMPVNDDVSKLGMAMYEADPDMQCQISLHSDWESYIQECSSHGYCVSVALREFVRTKIMKYKPTLFDVIDIADLCMVDSKPVSLVLISRFGDLICQTHPSRRTKLVLLVEDNHCALVSRGYDIVPGVGCTVETYIGEHFNMYDDETCFLTRDDLLEAGLWIGMDKEEKKEIEDEEPVNTNDMTHEERMELDANMTDEQRLVMGRERTNFRSRLNQIPVPKFMNEDYLEELKENEPPSEEEVIDVLQFLTDDDEYLVAFIPFPYSEFQEMSPARQRFAIYAILAWYGMSPANFPYVWGKVKGAKIDEEILKQHNQMHRDQMTFYKFTIATTRQQVADLLRSENLYATADMSWDVLYNQIRVWLQREQMDQEHSWTMRQTWVNNGRSTSPVPALDVGNEEHVEYHGKWYAPDQAKHRRIAIPVNEIKHTVAYPVNTHQRIAQQMQMQTARRAEREERKAERAARKIEEAKILQDKQMQARIDAALAEEEARREAEMNDEIAQMFAEAEMREMMEDPQEQEDRELQEAMDEIEAAEKQDQVRETELSLEEFNRRHERAIQMGDPTFDEPIPTSHAPIVHRRSDIFSHTSKDNMVKKTVKKKDLPVITPGEFVRDDDDMKLDVLPKQKEIEVAAPRPLVKPTRAGKEPRKMNVKRAALKPAGMTSEAKAALDMLAASEKKTEAVRPTKVSRKPKMVRKQLPMGQISLPTTSANFSTEPFPDDDLEVAVPRPVVKPTRTGNVPKKMTVKRPPMKKVAVIHEVRTTPEKDVITNKKDLKVGLGVSMGTNFIREEHESKEREEKKPTRSGGVPKAMKVNRKPLVPKARKEEEPKVVEEVEEEVEEPELINEPKVVEREPVVVDMELDGIMKQFGKSKDAGKYLTNKLSKLRTQVKKTLMGRGDSDSEIKAVLGKIKNAAEEVMPLAEQKFGLRVGQIKEALRQMSMALNDKVDEVEQPAHLAELFERNPAREETDIEIVQLKEKLAFDGPLVDSPAYGWSEKTAKGKPLTDIQMAKKLKAAENKRTKDVKRLARLEKEGVRKLKARRPKNEIQNDRVLKVKPKKAKQPELSLNKPRPGVVVPVVAPVVPVVATVVKKVQFVNPLEVDAEEIKKEEHEKVEYDPELHDVNFVPSAEEAIQVDFAKKVPGKVKRDTGMTMEVAAGNQARPANMREAIRNKLKNGERLTDEEKEFQQRVSEQSSSKSVPDRAGLVLRPDVPKFVVDEKVSDGGKTVILGKKSDIRASWDGLVKGKPKVVDINRWIREKIGVASLPKGFKLGKSKKVDKMNMVEAWLDSTAPRTAIKDAFLERTHKMTTNGANKQEWYSVYRELVPLQSDRVPIKEFKSKNAVHNVVMDLVEAGRRPPKHTSSRAKFAKNTSLSTNERMQKLVVAPGEAITARLEQKKALEEQNVDIEPLEFDELFKPVVGAPAVEGQGDPTKTWADLKKPTKRKAESKRTSKFESEESQIKREAAVREARILEINRELEMERGNEIRALNATRNERSNREHRRLHEKARKRHEEKVNTAAQLAVMQDRMTQRQLLKAKGIDLDLLAQKEFVPFAADDEEQFVPLPLDEEQVGLIEPDFGDDSQKFGDDEPEIDYNKTPSPVQMKKFDMSEAFNLHDFDFIPMPITAGGDEEEHDDDEKWEDLVPKETAREPRPHVGVELEDFPDIIGLDENEAEAMEQLLSMVVPKEEEPRIIDMDEIAIAAEIDLKRKLAKAAHDKWIMSLPDLPEIEEIPSEFDMPEEEPQVIHEQPLLAFEDDEDEVDELEALLAADQAAVDLGDYRYEFDINDIDRRGEDVRDPAVVKRELKHMPWKRAKRPAMKKVQKGGRNSDVNADELQQFNQIVNSLAASNHESAAYTANKLLAQMDKQNMTYGAIIKAYKKPMKARRRKLNKLAHQARRQGFKVRAVDDFESNVQRLSYKYAKSPAAIKNELKQKASSLNMSVKVLARREDPLH